MPDTPFVDLYAALHNAQSATAHPANSPALADTLPDEPAANPPPAWPNRTPTAMPGLAVKAPDPARGWKLAEGRGAYDWASTTRTEDVLRRLGATEGEMFTREFLSPNQAKGVLKARGVGGKVQKDLLGVLTRRVPGRPTLVREDDLRPALVAPDAGDAFDDLRQNGEDL
jgi:hypothetical protein